MLRRKQPTPPSDRDLFVHTAMQRANGQQIPARDALLALLTHQDIESLARRTGEPKDVLETERLVARRRLLQALGE